MGGKPETDWMSLAEIIEETGLSRATIYKAANENALPVPVYRFGKRLLVSRKAWQALHQKQHDRQAEVRGPDDV